MKIIYIAGKYSAKSDHERLTNINVARNEAEFVWARGGVALCPHLNSAWMSGLCDEKNFLDGYLLLIEKCDALFTCWNWMDSKGAMAEVERAKELGIQVFHSRQSVMEYLNAD